MATNTVAIQNFAFSPATVTVKSGTTITWTNRDSDAHTVTAMPAGSFHSPTLNTGQSFVSSKTRITASLDHMKCSCSSHLLLSTRRRLRSGERF